MTTPERPTRSVSLDIARSLALLAMAIYHFHWDLELFGLAARGSSSSGGWALFAKLIAGSFLTLAGLSLVLAHGTGFRRSSFLRRLAMILAAALAITIATFFATPESYIFFGILHSIALCSLLGVPFLRAPTALIIAASAAIFAAPHFLRADLFNMGPLLWVGLSTKLPNTNDYVPLLPWFGAFLAGMAAARILIATGLIIPLRAWGSSSPTLQALAFPGRHSLLVYLIHQPILIAAIWLALKLAGSS